MPKIVLAENAIATNEVTMNVEPDKALAVLEALAILSARRVAQGTTPLDVARVVT